MKYQFGELCLCSKTEKLYDNQQQEIKIEHQQFALLLLFLEQPNKLLSREQIVERVWSKRETSDEAIRVALKKLRDILKDNPKSPQFIKTIPKQGYKWIAEVKLIDQQVPWWSAYKLSLLMILFVLLCTLFIWLMFTQQNSTNIQNTQQLELLTNLSGSEVIADYHVKGNKLAFLHRESRGDPQQLYIKYLDTNETIRLSWDDQNYSNVNWSPDGAKLAFTHYAVTGKVLYVAHFANDQTLRRLDDYSSEQLSDKSVSDWTSDGQSLLLAAEFTPGKNHSIYQFTLATQALSPISFPNTSGRGDYAAKQSENGKYTAILRESEPGKINLIVVDAIYGNAVAQHSLDFTPSYMIWSADSTEVSLSSFFGEHLRFNVINKVVSYLPALPNNALDIFSHCGERCYVLRQHNGNFLDIQEKPLTSIFSSQDDLALISVGRLFKKAGAQDFPLYVPTTGQVIYASLHDSILSIKQVVNGSSKTLATLNDAYQLSSLTISPDGKTLAGSIQNRLFTASLSAIGPNDISFVTDTLEQASNPVWAPDSNTLLFSSFINKSPTILMLDLATNQRQEVLDNALAFKIIDANRAVLVKPNLDAFMYKLSNDVWQPEYKITRLQSANVNRWKVADKHLFFTKYDKYEAWLCKVQLDKSGNEPACQSIGKNRFRLHFDIDKMSQRILLVESLSAESNLIKMRW